MSSGNSRRNQIAPSNSSMEADREARDPLKSLKAQINKLRLILQRMEADLLVLENNDHTSESRGAPPGFN
ncbi:hypothetical protein CIPAW_14G046400 [Carya illinoinensis]|uniref:Uncharacterized protein n=1 Tax=Carya illinoinensis TaxID=32201 RepID=A0A8T1NJD1_CARIL|nr:hypothetical protein CIPAW_14G046400 [Carya illinoinensis]